MTAMTTLAARMAALADRFEADAPRSTSENGLLQAAEEIRAELAADGPQTVWAVHAIEYEDNGVRALFATREDAEGHRAQRQAKEKGNTYGVEPYEILTRLPKLLAIESTSARVYIDGRVDLGNVYSHEEWDYEVAETRGDRIRHITSVRCTDVGIWDENGNARVVRHVAVRTVLEGYAREHNWSAAHLAALIDRIGIPAATPKPQCYDASFGKVHFSASCRCPR